SFDRCSGPFCKSEPAFPEQRRSIWPMRSDKEISRRRAGEQRMAAFRFGFRLLAVLTLLGGLAPLSLAEVTAPVILGYKPAQNGVDYTMPSAGEIASCTIELEETGKAANAKATTAWVVKDGRGAILRKFHD